MKRGDRPELMWGLGLNEQQQRIITKAAGPGFLLRNFAAENQPWKRELRQAQQPSTLWVPWRVWSDIPEFRRQVYRAMDSTQRVLIFEEGDPLVEYEKVLEDGFLTSISCPLDRTKVQDALFRATEVTSLYSDIYSMTEEIMLERELLKRKTDQLLFLNKLLTSASESLDPTEILQSATDLLGLLVPLRSLQAVFWRPAQEGEGSELDIFLPHPLKHRAASRWTEFFINAVNRHGGGPVNGLRTSHIATTEPDDGPLPEHGRALNLALKAGQETYGVLVLLTDPDIRLAKDQVQTLRSAASHLGLALRNALLFRQVKGQADRDGLTSVYNRRTFDDNLVTELKRCQRYNTNLALLMIDLDHFKSINDTHGHPAGDEVLRRVGEILHNTVRTTDTPARYGGEEFAVILPHTSENDAWNLAERIRIAIAETVFKTDSGSFMVTASIGVSSLESGSLNRERDLLLGADQALYTAKANGRNMVVSSSRDALEALQQ